MTCPKFSDYVVLTEASPPPIDLSILYDHMKVDNPPDAGEIAYINVLLVAAIKFAEHYTRRDIIQRTYRAFSNTLYGCAGYEIRRTPIISVDTLKYFKDKVLTTIDSADYYITESPTYIHIFPVDQWPTDIDCRAQAVQLEFTSGYVNSTDVPEDILAGIYAHVTNMYQNRGDCSKASCQALLPVTSRAIYELNRIIDIRVC